MTRYGVTFTTPTPTCYPLLSHPLAVSGPFNPRSHGRSSGLPSTLDSLRFGWIDCLVPAQHWAHALSSDAQEPTTTRRELLSMSPSPAADPSPSLLTPSQKGLEIAAIFTGNNSPAPAGQRTKTLDPNANT